MVCLAPALLFVYVGFYPIPIVYETAVCVDTPAESEVATFKPLEQRFIDMRNVGLKVI